ncbi:MAG: alpha/beta fold hydrolase [Gammaproteobacteria bacterium]|nr:alpha/beta fold hydrolase [Gammaproteobacteria bacterium]
MYGRLRAWPTRSFRHTQLFFHQLNQEGCHVLSFDLLGHGFSRGEPCTIDDYRHHVVVVWQGIIRAIREHIPQGIPVVVMGYSYGFSLVIHALNELCSKYKSIEKIISKRVALVIGLSPAFKVGHTASHLVRFFSPVLAFMSRHVKNIPLMPIRPEFISDDESILNIIETDPKVFKGRINVQTARNVHIAGQSALYILPTIQLPFLLIFGTEDFVLPVTTKETGDREDIEIRMVRGGKHNIFDGDNLYAGRTLESITRAIEKYCVEGNPRSSNS